MTATKTELIMEAQAKGFEAVEKQVTKITEALTKLSNKKYTNTGFKAFTDQMKAQTEVLTHGFQKLSTEMDKLNTKVGDLGSSFQKTGRAGSNFGQQLAMGGGIKGYIADMEKMIMLQMRWYGARALLTAAVEVPFAALQSVGTYIVEIDKARSEMLRWGATSGEVTDKMRKDADFLVTQIRRVTTEFPVTFAQLSQSTQAFVGAGIDPSMVTRMLPDIARMQTAFKEIDFNSFAVALTGTFNVFKNTIKEAGDEAEAFAAIIDKLMKAQATGIIRPEQFTQVMQYMSQVGKISGFTLDQILAMSVAITDTGIRAQSASRLMASLMLTLQTSERGNYLKEVGITLDRTLPLAQQFDKLLADLGKKMGAGPMPVGWAAFLEKVAGKEQAKDLITMIERLQKYKDLVKAIEESKGGLVAASNVMSMPISSQWQIFLNILQNIGGEAGSGAASVMQRIMALAIDIANGALLAADATGKFYDKFEKLGSAGKLVYDSIRLVVDVFGSLSGVIQAVNTSGNYLLSFFGKFGTSFGQSVDSFRIGVEAMITVLLYATRHPAWAAFSATAFAISEWIRYMSKGMDEMDKKDNAFDFLMKTGKSSDIKAKIAELEALKETLDTLGRAGGDPLAIQKSLNQVNFQLAVAKQTLKSLSLKDGKSTGDVKGEPPPPEDIKGYESRLREAWMKELRMDNKMATLRRNQALAALELQHRTEGMLDTDYNAEKARLRKEASDEQIKNIEGTAVKLGILYDKEVERARYNEEKKVAIARVWGAAQAELEKMTLSAKTDAFKSGIEEQIKDYEDYKKYIERSEKSLYDTTISNINATIDAEKSKIEIRKGIAEDLYKRGEIRADEYYKRLRVLAFASTEWQIQAEKVKLQAFVDQQSRIRTALDEVGKALPADVEEQFDFAKNTKMEEFVVQVNKLQSDLRKVLSDMNLEAAGTPELVFSASGFGETFRKYLSEATKDFLNWGVQIKNVAEAVAKGIQSVFEEFFFDAMTGDLKSLDDYFKSVMRSIANIASQLLSKMAVAGLEGVISGYFNTKAAPGGIQGGGAGGYFGIPSVGAAVTHAGGVVGNTSTPIRFVPSGVFANAPRYHSGLAGDERAAILQVGETVIPKGSGFGPKSVIVNVKNETGTPVENKDVKVDFDLEKMVVGIILKNKASNGPLRYV